MLRRSLLILLTMCAVARAQMAHVTGRVVGPDGKPVANAGVFVTGTYSWERRLSYSPVARTTTDRDGRFNLEFDQAKAAHPPLIVASADGFGIGWSRAGGEVSITLPADDVPIEGRIVNADGKPIAGVTITVFDIGPIDQEALEAAYRKDPEAARTLSLALPFAMIGRDAPRTDADGRFRLSGIGENRKVWMFVHGGEAPGGGAAAAFSRVEACTKRMEPTTRRVDQPVGTSEEYVTYGSTFQYTARPAQSVEGIVRDAATHAPMANMPVWSANFAGPFEQYDPRGVLSCLTDANGRYRLDGFPRGVGNSLVVVPEDGQPYFMHTERIDEATDVQPIKVDVEMHKGVLVSGRITNKVTGAPIADAKLEYTTYLDNEHTADLPEFVRDDGAGHMQGFQLRFASKADGTYQLVAAPGKAIIGAAIYDESQHFRRGVGFDQIPIFAEQHFVFRLFQPPPFPQHTNVVREIDIPADAKAATCDLEMDPGETIRVNVVAADGKPIGPLNVRGITPENYGGWWAKTIAVTEFDAVAFSPDEDRTMIVFDQANGRGGIAHASVADAAGRSVTIELSPLATIRGKLVDVKDGSPLADQHFEARIKKESVTVRSGKTDANGDFSITLPFGASYYIMIDRGERVGTLVQDEITPQPGEQIDLGELKR